MAHLDISNDIVNKETGKISLESEPIEGPIYCTGMGQLLAIEEGNEEDAINSVATLGSSYVPKRYKTKLGISRDVNGVINSFCLFIENKNGKEEKWISFDRLNYNSDENDPEKVYICRPKDKDMYFLLFEPVVFKRIKCPSCGEGIELHFLDDLNMRTDEVLYIDDLKKFEKEQKKKKNDKKI